MDILNINENKEIVDFVKAYSKLAAQRKNPNRDDMIDALKEALKVACLEIKTVEKSRNETVPTPWEKIPDAVLYDKLAEYQQGLYCYAVNKWGEEVVKKNLINI